MAYTKELFEIEHASKPVNFINMVRLHSITAGIGALTYGLSVGSKYERGEFGERYSQIYDEGCCYCIAWKGLEFVALVCYPEKKKRKTKKSQDLSSQSSEAISSESSDQIGDPENLRETLQKFHPDLFESALEMIAKISVKSPGPKNVTTAIWSKGNWVHYYKSKAKAYQQGVDLLFKFFHSPKRVFGDIGEWWSIYNIPDPLRKVLVDWADKIKEGPYTITEKDIDGLESLGSLPGGLHEEAFPLAVELVTSQGINGFSQWLLSKGVKFVKS